MKQKILILRGLPGCGKSTYAKKLLAKDPSYKRVNKDEMRRMVDDGKYSREREAHIINLRDEFIYTSLELGYNVVVDDGNLHPKHIKRFEEIAEKADADLEVKFFDVELKTCIKQDLMREHSVGEKVIRGFYNSFIKPVPAQYVPPRDKPRAIIVDVDGTLAKCGDRDIYDGSKVYLDIVIEPIKRILIKYNENVGGDIIIMSGRDSKYREVTMKWLDDNNIPYDDVFMRKEDDVRQDSIVKEELFDSHIRHNYIIDYVLDDRLQVCRMWHSLGLTVLRCGDPDDDF